MFRAKRGSSLQDPALGKSLRFGKPAQCCNSRATSPRSSHPAGLELTWPCSPEFKLFVSGFVSVLSSLLEQTGQRTGYAGLERVLPAALASTSQGEGRVMLAGSQEREVATETPSGRDELHLALAELRDLLSWNGPGLTCRWLPGSILPVLPLVPTRLRRSQRH